MREQPKIWNIEHARPNFSAKPEEWRVDLLDRELHHDAVEAFLRNINTWYPALPRQKLSAVELLELDRHSVQNCLALLVLALGSASIFTEITGRIHPEIDHKGFSVGSFAEEYSSACFDRAFAMMNLCIIEDSVDSILCLFYAGYDNVANGPTSTNS
jgi:hypothetical protein